MKRKNDGFTLTEMIVVLVIIVILIALLVPTLTGYIDKAAKRACEANKASLRRELILVEIDDKLGGKLDVTGLQELAQKMCIRDRPQTITGRNRGAQVKWEEPGCGARYWSRICRRACVRTDPDILRVKQR